MTKKATILSEKYHGIMVVLLLTAIVLTLYWPVTGYEFIAMDDNMYVVENPDIQKGLSRQGIFWAMTTLYTTNWHPLTWLSLMADYEHYGLSAAGYHVSSLLLHILNTILLFTVLRRMTGETWKCLTVAALFGVHPLNIESVAWIAERKNLLSTFFWILTLFAYIRYVEREGWLRYLQALFLFALGLMAKPMLVTLPFVLLLLDYWPLRRFRKANHDFTEDFPESASGRHTLPGLLKEKIPFFLLSLLSVLITLYAAKIGGAAKSITDFPFSRRIGNALIAYISYLEKMIWPVDLAIFYPYPTSRPMWKFTVAFLSLTAVTVFVAFKRKKHPYLAAGWFWYLITLLPVIGIVQVGFQSMANRYAYVPLVGIFIIIAWGVPDLLRTQIRRWCLPAAAVALILILSFSTWAQLPHWRNSETAFRQALRVTEDNFLAQAGMGDVWQRRGDLQIARLHYQESLRIQPGYAEARNNLAVILMKEGRVAEAEVEFREALKHKPDLAEAHNNLGEALASQEKFQEAAAHFARALELKPGYVVAKENLAKLVSDRKIGIHK
ncbi:MAG: tetratricopeptide repeat protein [Deltaproteobacteria bacterium]|nr:tetratricopeptide repeat protein [Deltaproteobacteria bacterium]